MKKVLETMLSTFTWDKKESKLFLNIAYNTDNQIKNGIISASDLADTSLRETYIVNQEISKSAIFTSKGPFSLQVSESKNKGKVHYFTYSKDHLLQTSVSEIELGVHQNHNVLNALLNKLYSLTHNTVDVTMETNNPDTLEIFKSFISKETFDISDKCGMLAHSSIIMSESVYDAFFKITGSKNIFGSNFPIYVDRGNTKDEFYIINGSDDFEKPIVLSLYGLKLNNKYSKNELGTEESIYSIFVNPEYRKYITKVCVKFDDSEYSDAMNRAINLYASYMVQEERRSMWDGADASPPTTFLNNNQPNDVEINCAKGVFNSYRPFIDPVMQQAIDVFDRAIKKNQ